MPSAASEVGGQGPVDIVLGDCHGTTCAPEIIDAVRSFLARRNFSVAMNTPYAGGFTTAHYGNPRRGRHALQIEINRALYMDERRCRRRPELSRLAAEMTALVAHLAAIMGERLGEPPRVAAE
jgi:N-formylglutamate amidohydrolase